MSDIALQKVFIRSLLYVFGFATIFYPILTQFAQPFILASMLGITILVAYGTLALKRPLPVTSLYYGLFVLVFVYFCWAGIAFYYGNNPLYVFQDSFGFLFYLFSPVLFLFIKFFDLKGVFFRGLFYLCTFISLLSLGIIITYHAKYGPVEHEPLLQINQLIKSFGLNWAIGHNMGFIGVYTWAGHFLLLGIGLAYYRYFLSRRSSYLYLIFLYSFGVLADGHRGLLASLFFLVFLLIPLLRKTFAMKKLLVHSLLFLVLTILFLIFNFTWISDRFNFSDSDPSTLQRFLQVPALIDKIFDRPFLGSGFGSFASIIRNSERPFLYEVDFLATIMKLGVIGTLLYFGSYFCILNVARRRGHPLGYIFFCVGSSFFLYMGTNGGTAMSPDTSIFHMFLFIAIAISEAIFQRGIPGSNQTTQNSEVTVHRPARNG